MIQFNNTIKTLNTYGDLFRHTYQDNNSAAGYDPQSELNNISFTVTSSNGIFSIDFNLPDYWKYAESGRGPGKMPPKGSLTKWLEWKRILPSPVQLPSGNTYIPSMESLEYVIRRKIGREGTEGSHTWEMTENELKDRLIRDVTQALKQDIIEYLNQSFKSKI